MPKNELPDAARVLPPAGQKVWLKAFNEALTKGLPEDEASAQAWAAVKRAGYHKIRGGKWGKNMDEDFNGGYSLQDDIVEINIPIFKVDAKKRVVEGFATLDNIDEAGDVVDAGASEEAFSKWFGNIREMHGKKAVGKAISWEPGTYTDEETGETYKGIWVKAKISKGAEDTWQKVLDGTLAGFSIGGAVQEKERAMKKTFDGETRQVWKVTKYRLTELSLVDSPCNRLATVSLAKSIDGVIAVDDIVDDIEKATNTETGKFVDMSSEMESVISALVEYRNIAIAESADYEVAALSNIIAEFKNKKRWEEQDAKYHAQVDSVTKSNEPNKEETMADNENDLEKSDETLQNDKVSDTTGLELTDEDKSVFRKFVEFIKGESVTDEVEEATPIEKGESEMDNEQVASLVDEKVEALVKSSDEKFDDVAESLKKIASALETVAKSDDIEAVKNDFTEKLGAIEARLETVETGGAVQKSGDDTSTDEEKIEKNDGGFWGDAILPGYAIEKG